MRLWNRGLLTATALCLLTTLTTIAQDEAQKTDAPAEAAPAEEQSPSEEWAALVARKDELAKRFSELKKDFNDPDLDRAAKQKIVDEFQVLLGEYNTQIKSRLVELAPKIYAADAKNELAGRFVVEAAFNKNRYEESAAAANKLLDAGVESRQLLNMAVVSNFAIHEFEKAQAQLKIAEEKQLVDFSLAGRYAEDIPEYIELWKAEQKIREAEAKLTGDEALPRVEFDTDRGKVVLELFENEAPNTVANFISLVENETYNGIKFHRVIPGFMAQGGDPNSKDADPSNDGLGGPGYTIKCECYEENARKHFRGSLSMAKSAAPNTGGSQFFLTHLPTPHLNANAELQTGHTVFGRIVEGMDVVAALEIGDTIKTAKVLNKRPHEYKPETTPDAEEK